MILEFTIPGKITSANRVTRHVGRRALKSESARLDQARIHSIAWAASKVARWLIPEVAGVSIVAYNSRLDVGNIEKVINDAIKGVLIVDDNPKHLRRLLVEHGAKDKKGERYVVTVEAY